MARIDERDIMFSRMEYKDGTDEYKDYYGRNPEKKEVDDFLRSLPGLGEEGSAFYDSLNSPIVNSTFRFLSQIKVFSEGLPSDKKTAVDPVIMTKKLKALAKYYNAKLVGIAEMKDYHYYSHRGREPKDYGTPIERMHKYGIVFAVEMDKEMIFRAPQLSEAVAVTKGYVEAAIAGMILSYYIRELGFDARNHMDGNYLVIAPLVAQDAGLGEIGRNGLLITREFGPRVRLGVVTTDMPLICDERADFGISEFCQACGVCAKTCPGQVIPKGDKAEIDGIKRWKITAEECYKRWRLLGSDCGVCMASCPFSDNVPQELIDKMKDSKDAVVDILEKHSAKNGIRPYVKNEIEWMQNK